MPLLDHLYLLTTGLLTLAGLTMVAFAVRAYRRTTHRSMIHLALGFTFIVAAALATTISAFMIGFSQTRSLLTVHTGLTTTGYLFLLYSVRTFE